MQPGDHDPSVALAVSKYNIFMTRERFTHNSPSALRAVADATKWEQQATRMGRGETLPWWQQDPNASSHDEMSYECDAGLGTPSEVDCTQIEWQQLGPPSDTITISPNMATFLHSNSCYLAISASISIVVSWRQIRTALSTLMSVCVQAPFGPAQGGRAYYRAPQRLSGRREKRDSLTGK